MGWEVKWKKFGSTPHKSESAPHTWTSQQKHWNWKKHSTNKTKPKFATYNGRKKNNQIKYERNYKRNMNEITTKYERNQPHCKSMNEINKENKNENYLKK